jgi:hypothetical protein
VYTTSLIASCRFFSVSLTLSAISFETEWIQSGLGELRDALPAHLPLEPRLRLEVEPRLLLKPARAADRVAQPISRARRRIAVREQREHARR